MTIFKCVWDFPALILLVIITALYIIRRTRLKKECAELEEALKEKEAQIGAEKEMNKTSL